MSGARRRAVRGQPPLPVVAAASALAAVAACGLGCGGDPQRGDGAPAQAPNILLITVDTLRADHLSAYGYPRETSPRIAALAAEGVRFDQPAVQWPKTGPSFASMFTATYPSDNRIVRKVGIELPCRFLMLAEMLQRHGYSTHAVVSNGALASELRFDQGFDTYVETWKLGARDDGLDPNGAAVVTELALAVAGGIDPERPSFLWVHYLDPHFPYQPPAPWRDRFVDDAHFDPAARVEVADKRRQEMVAIGTEQVLEGRRELAFYVARYDEEIAYADHQIGVLLDGLEARGLRHGAVTVLTSDHGESLGEHHYYFDHGRFGFETCVRVPFIVHAPDRFAAAVDPRPVELIHLAPTLLELAGLPLDEGAGWMQGRSLVARLRGAEGDPGTDRVAFSEAGYATHGRWQRIVRDQRFKLIHAQRRGVRRWLGGQDVFLTLYDLAEDPAETVHVGDRHPEDLRRLRRLLWEHKSAPPFDVLRDDVETCVEGESGMDPETEALLRALGYL